MDWVEEFLGDRVPVGGESQSLVRRKATGLIRETRSRLPGWSPPPFDPHRYAEALRIPVRTTPEIGDWDALLVPIGKSPRIFLNSRVSSRGRLAFSLAHELGHLFFEGYDEETHLYRTERREEYYRTEEALALERLCDLAAAELLMPVPWFASSLCAAGLRASSIPRLADEFAVSLEAAAIRMLEFAKRPAAVGFFRLAPRPSADHQGQSETERRLAYRVVRAHRSPGFPFLFPRGKSVPDESAVQRASLGLAELSAVEEFRLGSVRRRLRVTAFPLHRRDAVEGPPRVCAVFELEL